MRITVAICTWNRAKLLDQTLAEMHKLVIPAGVGWDLLVVNNNCTDNTDKVIARHVPHLPIRRLFEPKPGKSHALNLATREARGEYILWTDDDVLVDEKWMVEYCQAFSCWPDAAIFGGPVDPWFDGVSPEWLRRVWFRVANAYAMRDFGEEPIRFTQNIVPFGVNLAVRREDQQGYFYDPSLGPRPNSALRGEETSLVRRMLAEGAEGWWVPKACVRHFIPKERQTTSYLGSYFFGQGQVHAHQVADGRSVMLFGKPRWLWRQAVEAEVRYRFRRHICRPEIWIEDLITSSYSWGLVCGYISSISQ